MTTPSNEPSGMAGFLISNRFKLMATAVAWLIIFILFIAVAGTAFATAAIYSTGVCILVYLACGALSG